MKGSFRWKLYKSTQQALALAYGALANDWLPTPTFQKTVPFNGPGLALESPFHHSNPQRTPDSGHGDPFLLAEVLI